MKKRYLLLLFLFAANVYANQCLNSFYIYDSTFNKKQKSEKAIIEPLKKLGQCGWIAEGTSAIITTYIKKDNLMYSSDENTLISGDINTYEELSSENKKWLVELDRKIRKTVMSELYYANLKYIDIDIVRNIESKIPSLEVRQEYYTKKPLLIDVSVALNKYNSNTHLYYGMLNIKISKYKNMWSNYLNDSYTFSYDYPAVGYETASKILQENILSNIKQFLNFSIKEVYISYKSITRNHEYTLTSTYDWGQYEKDNAHYIGIALKNYKDKINFKIKYEEIPDWYLEPIAKRIINDDKILTQELISVLRKLYPYRSLLSYNNLNKEEIKLVDNALLRVKELKK